MSRVKPSLDHSSDIFVIRFIAAICACVLFHSLPLCYGVGVIVILYIPKDVLPFQSSYVLDG